MTAGPVGIDHWQRPAGHFRFLDDRRRRVSPVLVTLVAGGSAAGGAVAGCHPTGTPVFDPLYTAVLAATVAVAASRSHRAALLVTCLGAVVLSRGVVLVPAGAGMLSAFVGTFPRRAPRPVLAVAGALAVQAVLRWPHVGFQGLDSLLAAAVVAPCLVSTFRQLRRRARRRILWAGLAVAGLAVLVVIPVGVEALEAHAAVSRGIEATEGALTGLNGGGDESGVTQLQGATADFASASRHANSWLTVAARLVPVAAQQRQALAVATSVATRVTSVAGREAGHVNLSALRYTDGRIDLAALTALDRPVGVVDRTLGSASSRIRGLDSAWLVSPIHTRVARLDAEVAKGARQASLAHQVLQAAPAILGGDGTRHYFIAFMTPSESRGLGGFIGAFGELRVDDGAVTLTRSGPIDELNTATGRKITGPADYLARYGQFDPQDHFQDLTYSPDAPTVAQVIGQMYPQSGGDRVDGVLVIDPAALATLLQFTGPIDVPGLGTLTSANAAEELEVGQYIALPGGSQQGIRHDFLQDALRIAFRKLSAGSLPDPQALAAALDPDVREGDLLFWSLHRKDQPILRRVGLAGAFPRAGKGDLLAVTTQNAGNNKLDAYLQRTITDRVRYDPGDGETVSTVTIRLHNEAPSSGLPSTVIGSYPGSGLPPGTNRTWLSLYSPLALQSASEGGKALPMGATPELGVEVYTDYVDIPAGATVTLTLHLAGRLATGSAYRIAVRQQPMVHPDHTTVLVSPAPGWHREGAGTWRLGADEVQRRTVQFRS